LAPHQSPILSPRAADAEAKAGAAVKITRRLRLCCAALRAVYHAHRRRGRRRVTRNKKGHAARVRRRALLKLGGRCACCGAGFELWPCLQLHHTNHNGEEHRRTLAAIDVSVAAWVLLTEDPSAGLFAVEVLCLNCHTMEHAAGRCPHRQKGEKQKAA
jgi:hypothetical protein